MFAAVGRFLAKPALALGKWVITGIIVPIVQKYVVQKYKEIMAKKEANKRAAEAQRRNDEYQSNPTDETFGESP